MKNYDYKEHFKNYEIKLSVKQFGEEFVNMAKKYPNEVRFLNVDIIEWEELKKRFGVE